MSRYISNGTMGDMWMSAWCYRCTNDHHMSHTPEERDGCEIIIRMMSDEYPIAELTDNFSEHGHEGWGPCCLTCSSFVPCSTCGVADGYRPDDRMSAP